MANICEQNVLEAKGIYKSYGMTQVLKNVDFTLRKAEIHALLGANGAGKSTLMNVLDGIVPSDQGSIHINGQPVRMANPQVARQYGIGMVHQELSVLPNVSIAENIFINRLPRNKLGFIRWKKLFENTAKVLISIGLDVDPQMQLGKLTVADQQMVEIARTISMDLPIILLDEPTSALSEAEIKRLMELILRFKSEGRSVIFITHKLNEILAVSDRVTVLRDGELVDVITVKERDKRAEQKLVALMIGENKHSESEMFPSKGKCFGEIMLEVENLTGNKGFMDVSFFVRKGEVVGITGLKGAKRTEVMRAVFGADKYAGGTIKIKGVEQKKSCIRNSIANGVAMITEDRKKEGFVPLMSVKENITLTTIQDCVTASFIQKSKVNQKANRYVEMLHIKVHSINTPVKALSGGNQQKVVLSKWLAANPEILIMDEPTRGIDIKSKMEIYRLIRQIADNGAAVVVVSSEIPEAMGIADRIYVMREGRIAGELESADIENDTIMHIMFGHTK